MQSTVVIPVCTSEYDESLVIVMVMVMVMVSCQQGLVIEAEINSC
jgi:hypothetical protein